ncbi:MAG: tRNA guanosine(34) transglycosylase Tgt [Planctomycetota bacterium]|nr:MAG: tRNA guanosine(34) transglycosylase Tgt [Planctomycetota bacterium]
MDTHQAGPQSKLAAPLPEAHRATWPLRWTALASDQAARCGQLHSPHGSVQTPAFMAVGTLGSLKGITVQQAEALGQEILLANTYHLALRPGAEVVHQLGGVHGLSGWRGPMLTDSGGYQVFSLADNRQLDESGVRFKSHLDGSTLHLTPEESIRVQRFLGADIIMAFDECPDLDASPDALRASIERTLRWLERSVQSWRDQQQGWPGGAESQALFGIVQGGLDQELRHFSAKHTLAHELPGYAIGGLSVGESAYERNQVLDWVTPLLPADRPRYLMGVGTPLDLVEAVYRGIDLFDCVLPTRMGRHGIAYTDAGPLHLKRQQYRADARVIDEDTPSEASRVSRGTIRHLLHSGESLGGQLLGIHNLAYYQRLMRRVRTAIQRSEMGNFVENFRRTYQPREADSQQ